MTNWFPSVLWHCWFAHLACKNCPRDDLLCVEWDVKPYTLHLHPGQPTTSPIIYFHRHSLGGVISGGTKNFHSGRTTTDQEVWRTEVPSRVRGRIPGKRSNTVYRFWLQKRPKVENFAQFTSWFVICVSDGGWAAKRQSLWLASTLGLAWYSKRLPLGDLKCNFFVGCFQTYSHNKYNRLLGGTSARNPKWLALGHFGSDQPPTFNGYSNHSPWYNVSWKSLENFLHNPTDQQTNKHWQLQYLLGTGSNKLESIQRLKTANL